MDESDEIPKGAIKKTIASYKIFEEQIKALSTVPNEKRLSSFSGALRGFVLAFTEINKQYEFIETMEREEIYEAELNLLNCARKQYGLVMSDEEFKAVFDESRDW